MTGYTAHAWVEYAGTGAQKAGWLNTCETQYTAIADYCDTTTHDTLFYTEAQADAKYYGPSTDGTGSGLVCEYWDGYTGDEILAAGVSPYTIFIWSGAVGDIPTGYHLCDGRDAYTPDLRDRFVVGAGGTYNLHASGGANTVASTASAVTIGSHTLTTDEIPAHAHTGIVDYWNTDATGEGAGGLAAQENSAIDNSNVTGYTGGGGGHTHSGSTLSGLGTTNNNMPPYLALAFIIKEV